MSKATAILPILCLLSLPAQAQSVQIISVFDDSPLTKECDAYFGGETPTDRPCFVMSPGDPRATPTNWGLTHNNPRFHLTITGPAGFVAWYDQSVFLNTPFTLAKYGPPTSAAFAIAIGVNSTTIPCTGPGAFSPSHAEDFAGAQNSAALTAKCNGFVPAGQTVFLYPITARRDGVGYFSGDESVLTAEVFQQ